MVSAHEIRQVLNANNANGLADTYQLITGKPLDRHCGSCLADARKVLQVRLNELERESAPLHLYLINPSEETLWQCEQLGLFDRITVVNFESEALALFESTAVNIISKDAFFDSTILEAKKIKPYQVYRLDYYAWNGNGHATSQQETAVWICRGTLKKDIHNLSGYAVSNPYEIIHAIKCA